MILGLLGRGAFGRYLGHEAGALMDAISVLMKEARESSLAPSPTGGHKQTPVIQKRALTPPCRLAASGTVRCKCLLFISHTYGL